MSIHHNNLQKTLEKQKEKKEKNSLQKFGKTKFDKWNNLTYHKITSFQTWICED